MKKSDDYIMIRIPKSTKEAIQQKASDSGLSMSSYLKMLIAQDLKK